MKKGADSVVELQKQVDIQNKLLEVRGFLTLSILIRIVQGFYILCIEFQSQTARDNVSKVLGEITTVDKQLQHETLKAQSTKTELE